MESQHPHDAETIAANGLTKLPFPPLKKSHILNCSVHSWYPQYRSITPKARLVKLTQPFLDYLRADGILLPPEEYEQPTTWSDSDSGIFSGNDDRSDGGGNDSDTSDEAIDPSRDWPDVHDAIKEIIRELGGKVVPKLNWSAPKDSTWISPSNSMECLTPNDVYLLLKASDFITHDLEHPFDDCVEEEEEEEEEEEAVEPGSTPKQNTSHLKINDIPYHLVLRKYVLLNPSVEFRCFVRNRKLLGICQRDQNHFEFLFGMKDRFRNRIETFFNEKIRDTFPDPHYAFDVYIPPPHTRVWLVDVNPWAQRTDPLLFSWLELLTMPEPRDAPTVSLKIGSISSAPEPEVKKEMAERENDDNESVSSEESADEEVFVPDFRLIRKDDPEAYNFSSTQYSAHKLPKEVVDASQGGAGGMAEFANQWKDMLEQARREQQEESSSSEED